VLKNAFQVKTVRKGVHIHKISTLRPCDAPYKAQPASVPAYHGRFHSQYVSIGLERGVFDSCRDRQVDRQLEARNSEFSLSTRFLGSVEVEVCTEFALYRSCKQLVFDKEPVGRFVAEHSGESDL